MTIEEIMWQVDFRFWNNKRKNKRSSSYSGRTL